MKLTGLSCDCIQLTDEKLPGYVAHQPAHDKMLVINSLNVPEKKINLIINAMVVQTRIKILAIKYLH